MRVATVVGLALAALASTPARAIRDVGEVRGRILRDGKPVVGAEVTFDLYGGPGCVQNVRQSRTDADGRFTLSQVDDRTTGFLEIGRSKNGASVGRELYVDAERRDFTISLGRGASIAGRVTIAPTGTPVAGVPVCAFLVDPRRLDACTQFTMADADGNYALRGLQPGRYWVTPGAGLHVMGTRCDFEGLYPAEFGKLAGQSRYVEVKDGDAAPADFTMSRGGRVTVKVVLSEKGPPYCSVHFIDIVPLEPVPPTDRGFDAEVINGVARIEAVPAGLYRVRTHSCATISEPIRVEEDRETVVTVAPEVGRVRRIEYRTPIGDRQDVEVNHVVIRHESGVELTETSRLDFTHPSYRAWVPDGRWIVEVVGPLFEGSATFEVARDSNEPIVVPLTKRVR